MKKEGYGKLPQEAIMDKALSWKSKGILAYLLTRPPGWKIRVANIIQMATDGSASVRAGLQELRDTGWLDEPRMEIDPSGRATGWTWTVNKDRAAACNGGQGEPETPEPVEAPDREPRRVKTCACAPKPPELFAIDPQPERIPEKLNTPAFTEAWARWKAYRKKLRRPGNGWEEFFFNQLKTLEILTPDQAAACIKASMDQGWVGLFPEKYLHRDWRNPAEKKEITYGETF